MPVFESNLTIMFGVLLALAAIGALCAALWKPVLSRLWRYLQVWWERDRIAEQEAQRERDCRERAARELKECLHEDDSETAPVSSLNESTVMTPREPASQVLPTTSTTPDPVRNQAR